MLHVMTPLFISVMLSVYVPPGSDHPNKGMMPGDQFKDLKKPHSAAQGVAGKHQSAPHGVGGWLNKILSSSSDKAKDIEDDDNSSSSQELESEATHTATTTAKPLSGEKAEMIAAPDAEDATTETHQTSQSESSKHTKQKGSKRKRSMDRARTLAVAAAALAGSKKEKEKTKQTPVKLTPQQRSHRNLVRLQALCRIVPLPNPTDPVRARSWEAWADREEGSVTFRNNRRSLISHLNQRKLSIDSHSSKGAGSVLRQMLSVRDITSEMENVIKCAVELEAAKSQRHDVSLKKYHHILKSYFY